MTSEQFTYWLQGYAEICGTEPTAEQWQIIKDHLALTFHKVTPLRGIPEWSPSRPPYQTGAPNTAVQPYRIDPVVTC